MSTNPVAAATQPVQLTKPLSTLDQPTNNPDIPVTHGSPFGPGAGVEALGRIGTPTLYSSISNLANFDPTGQSEALANIILNKGL
jgi:hypothetical protein